MLKKKKKFALFDRYDTGFIDVEMDRSVLDEKSYFKMLGLSFSSKIGLGILNCLYC